MTAAVSPIQVPVLTGFVRSFVNTRLEIAGLTLPGGYGEVMRKRTRTRERIYGNNVDPVGDTDGQNQYEATVSFYFDWYANFVATLRNAIGPGYGSAQFDAFLGYTGTGGGYFFDALIGCKFDNDEINAQKGTGALVCSSHLNPLKIYFAIPDGANYADPLYDDNPDPLDTQSS